MMASQQQGLTKLTNLYLEMISVMSRRYFQIEWPNLFPKLTQYLGSSDLSTVKTVFECVKKVCKKYRYMFRSDDLFREILYVDEAMSQYLLQSLTQCVEMAQNPQSAGDQQLIRTLFGVMNSILHIIESLISQEELLDNYETNLNSIMGACQFILS
jgi:exportin-2 (importin alpha re-exporter)